MNKLNIITLIAMILLFAMYLYTNYEKGYNNILHDKQLTQGRMLIDSLTEELEYLHFLKSECFPKAID